MFKRLAHFYTEILRDFKSFYYFNPEAKLEDHFAHERSAIENAKAQYKSDQSDANVKTNSMSNIKGTHPKERYFATNCLNFLKIKYVYTNILEIIVFMCLLLYLLSTIKVFDFCLKVLFPW